MQEIDKNKFINDIRDKLNIKIHKNEYIANYEKYDEVSSEEIGKIFKKIFKENNEDKKELSNVNNVYVECKIRKEESIEGCRKIVNYTKIAKNNKKEKCKLELVVPKETKNGQKILVRKEGNNANGIIGNLVINIKVKGEK